MKEELISKSIRVKREDWNGFRKLSQIRGEHNWKTFEYLMEVFINSPGYRQLGAFQKGKVKV